jgi:hypothetical protein
MDTGREHEERIAGAPQGARAPALDAAIRAMAGTLALAEALVDAGRRIDLDGLDREIAAICAAARAAPRGADPQLRDALIGLRTQIERLALRLPPA